MSKVDSILIRPIVAQDYRYISKIHRLGLPNDLVGQLGPDFLVDEFYPRLLGETTGFGLVAECDAQPVAYICFNSNRDFFSLLIRQRFGKMFLLSLCQIWNIRFVYNCLQFLMILAFRRLSSREEGGVELAYLVVHPEHQAHGLGGRLVQQGIQLLQERGAHSCWLKTLSKTTRNVRFYEKQGFQIYQVFSGRTYLHREV